MISSEWRQLDGFYLVEKKGKEETEKEVVCKVPSNTSFMSCGRERKEGKTRERDRAVDMKVEML